MGERDTIKVPRQILVGDGVTALCAMRTCGEVYLPQRVAARLCPISCHIVCVGGFQHMTAERERPFTHRHSKGAVVVVANPEMRIHCVRRHREGTLACHITPLGIQRLIHVLDDAPHLKTSRVGVGVCHPLPIFIAVALHVAVAKVPDDAVGGPFHPAMKAYRVVHTPDAVLRQRVGGHVIHLQVVLSRLDMRIAVQGVFASSSGRYIICHYPKRSPLTVFYTLRRT